MSINGKKGFWVFFLALVWVLFVIIGYYYFHKPIRFPQAISLGKSVLNLLIGGGITILAGGIGRRIFQEKIPHSGELVVIQAVLGFGTLSLALLLVGILGGYVTWISWMIFIFGLLIFRNSSFSWLQDAIAFLRQYKPSGGLEKTIFIGGSILVGIQLLAALAPPTAWDSLMYHLELPRQYLNQGRFHFAAGNYYWGQTQLTEILYTWCAALFKFETGTTLNWFMLMLFLAGVFGTAQRYSRSGAWVSIAALLAGETFRLSMGSGYVDGISALFGYAVWVLLINWMSERQGRFSIWIGILFGLAVWVKLTNLVLLPILLLSILAINLWNSRAWWKGYRSLLVGFLIILPWAILLWIYTGNPFYPHIFETPWVNSARYSFFNTPGTAPGFSAIWMPLTATWHGLHRVFVEGKLIFATDIGPLLLSFGLIGLIFQFKERVSKIAAIWLGCGWIVLILGGLTSALLWQTRLYFVLLTPAALLVGFGWETISKVNLGQVRLRILLSAVVILVVSLILVQDLGSTVGSGSFGVLIGTTSQEEYLEKNLGWYIIAARRLHELPQADNILALWEPRGLYLPDNTQADVWIDRWFMTLLDYEASDEIIINWQQQDITHLLINLNGMEYEMENNNSYTDEGWLILEEVLESFPEPELVGDEYAIYTIR
jgi:hypothetical protein